MRLTLGIRVASAAIICVLAPGGVMADGEYSGNGTAGAVLGNSLMRDPVMQTVASETRANMAAATKQMSGAEAGAMRRALQAIQNRQILLTAPDLRAMVLDNSAQPGSEKAAEKVAILEHVASGFLLKYNDTVQMKAPCCTIGDGGPSKGRAVPIGPGQTAISPNMTAAGKKVGAVNAPLDITTLSVKLDFIVELRSGTGGRIHCSGSLLTSRIVLTAAHCVSDSLGKPLNEATIEIRSVTGGAMAHGKPHSIWMPIIAQDQAAFAYAADIGTITLDRDLDVGGELPKVEPALGNKTMWVQMSGVGITDKTGVQLSAWNTGYVSKPQLVQFGSLTDPNSPATALIAWVRSDNASSQCGGDSGGPVFAIDGGSPVIVGVLSVSSALDDPSTVAGCKSSSAARFVNLAHPFVELQLCSELASKGAACLSTAAWAKS